MSLLSRSAPFLVPVLAALAPTAQEPTRAPSTPLLRASCAGLDALLADPRDAGLRRALSMLDERLLELPAELGGELPEAAVRLLTDLFLGAHDLEVRVLPPTAMQDGAAPVEVQLRSFGDAAKARSIAASVASLLEMGGMASEPVAGATWQRVALPVGALLHGALPPSAGREGYFVSFGEPHDWTPQAAADLPPDARPVLSLEIDGAAVEPYLRMAVDMAGPQGDVLFDFLDRFGLLGDKVPGLRLAIGQGEQRMHSVTRVVHGVSMAESVGFLSRRPLQPEELRLLPADARMAWLSRVRLDFLPELLEMVADASGEDLLGEFREHTGFDLEQDFVAPLGDLVGGFASESSGGGLASTVLLLGVDDEARLEATIAKLDEHLAALEPQTRGYVALRAFELRGQRCRSLLFPGLPIPFEPSFALRGGVLWAAATRQALDGALAQAEAAARGDAGLLGDARFRQAFSGRTDDLSMLQFVDLAHAAREGYGLASLACAALANAVRSPHDAARDPGVLLPSLAELLRGAQAAVNVTRIEGDDLVSRMVTERSMALQVAAALGNPMMLAWGLGAGINAALQARMRQQAMFDSEPFPYEIYEEEEMPEEPEEPEDDGY